MASCQLIALALVTIFLPTLTMAAEHIVGDEQGWTVNFNYTTWASGKVFHVGDTLVFNYKPPHNLFKVDGAGFKDCAATGEPMTSGNDIIKLSSPGKKWYICGYGKHCSELGQKLVINVKAETPAPTPEPNAAYGLAASCYQIFAAAVALVAMIAA
ncbi:PREDICTED: mavicyanin-like [Populus euphratica]|uniref:Mavicyanin-like n=1 Tax=Populus euphratica TaxID=75702 RepID=A0AAJ6TS05_POPEU|nr:PREDICTED: mavicyanin-like [Populus euphratica]